MFPTSTQRKYWTFSGETEIQQLRKEANERFIKKHMGKMSNEAKQNILNPEEENLVCRCLETTFKDLSSKMPRYATALLTCLYVACKVEEVNIHIDNFVRILEADHKKLTNVILTFELLVLQKLHYHLIVHNPYRSLEGLFIDLKTRSELKESAERLRKEAENYLTSVLLKGASPEELKKTVYQIKRIKYLVKSQEPLDNELVGRIRKKLDKCRNRENDPNSEEKKKRRLRHFWE
ncbi:hypothetical protein KUTeg_014821 [Tegillarca granosa]|uniref:Cyclin N-terminal domain-containing protein n=1 Tax=Tegillarca granosa TaxID=220873 RepID=A0ABQ9EVA1_TEGGR|nr:hypothetical protein KUTeg_014821 [Tegillarca granosa]